MRLLHLFFCILVSIFGYAQVSKAHIDSLITYENSRLRKEGKFEECIILNKKIIALSEQKKYIRGIGWGYKGLGNSLGNLGRYKESLDYLNLAREKANIINDYELKSLVANEIGKNYNDQKVAPHQAIKQFKLAEEFAHSIKDKYDRETQLLYSYENQASAYFGINVPDSAKIYLHKAMKIEENTYDASSLAHYYLKHDVNLDSARHYLQVADKLLKIHPEPFESILVHNKWGHYYRLNKQYAKAIEYYEQALKYEKQVKDVNSRSESLLQMSECYQLLGNTGESAKYLKLYSTLLDSINAAYAKEVGHTVNNIIKDEKKESQEKITNLQLKLWGSIVFAVIILGATVYIYVRNEKRKKSIIAKSESLLTEKDNELQSVQKKINPAFESLLELARQNHPSFYSRFQETYPNIQQKLLEINPDLQLSEFTLCAYIYLDFQTKDIAAYTFKSIRTIQSRKNRLRKRLDIPSDEDLYLWIKQL
ncbi:tetratricopeptide repeat protein [Flavobacterium sp. PLA-1-15]|uniref:tetratricopeptide repeat protein n=1 Tax=Flavobacterium sp. PLA-1-15 TaxID=3380533 RepID=UPI003B7E5230